MTDDEIAARVARDLAEAAAAARRARLLDALADLVKQFLLLIIALGFGNAFTLLVRPTGVADLKAQESIALPLGRFLTEETLRADLIVFLIYLLIGLRFLWTNWLYLSDAYQKSDGGDGAGRSRSEVLLDVFRILISGIAIGVQSSYASLATLHSFFWLFNVILLINFVSQAFSTALNWTGLDERRRKDSLNWTVANFVWFWLGVIFIPNYQVDASLANYAWSILIAVLSNSTSIGITWIMYFSKNRKLGDFVAKPLIQSISATAGGANTAWKAVRNVSFARPRR